jgi:hypothetical protein
VPSLVGATAAVKPDGGALVQAAPPEPPLPELVDELVLSEPVLDEVVVVELEDAGSEHAAIPTAAASPTATQSWGRSRREIVVIDVI